MKFFYRKITSFSFLLLPAVSFSQNGQEFFRDTNGFFFFIGIDNYVSVHLVWDEISNPSLKEFTLERSDGGKQFKPVATHTQLEKLTDLMSLSEEEQKKVNDAPYNRLLYSTETGFGRFIYNEAIPDFMANNKNFQWYYRIAFTWNDGKVTYSGTRSFDFYFDFRKKNDSEHSHTHTHSLPEGQTLQDEKKEFFLPDNTLLFQSVQPDALKTNDPVAVLLAPCPNPQTPPNGSCSISAPQTLYGTCCSYTQRVYLVPNSNCMGTCCCNIDCSPSSWDWCCVHNCSQRSSCSCVPWSCCGGTNQTIVTSKTNLTPPNVSASSTSAPCASGNSISASASGGTGPYTYLWNPGGYTTPTVSNVPPGNYTVTVTDANGCTNTATVTVTSSNPSPVASFTANNVCLGQTTFFTDGSSISSGSITGWSWNFGDATTSTLQNPSHTYTASGTYSVTLTVTSNAGCTNTITLTVTVYPQPVANFSATTVCLGNATQFTNQSTGGGTSWSWNFGDATSSTLQNPSHTYTSPGNYTVTLTVTGPGGCNSTISLPVTVYSQPIAAFTANNVCLGQTTTFTDQSTGGGTSWSWNFGDATSSTLQSPTHTYTASGTYTVTLNVSGAGGCNSTATQVVTVYPQPLANFSATTVCLGNATQFTNQSTGGGTSWSWNFGDATTSTQQSPSHIYPAAGNYSVTLTVTGPGGCSSTITQNVTVYPPAAANFTTTPVCVNNPTLFNDLSINATSWSWNFGDPASGGNNTSALQNPSHTYTVAGTYSVMLTVTSGSGCSNTATQTVTVNPKPSASFTAPVVCFNNPTVFADLTGGNPVSWQWDFGDTTFSTLQNPVHTYNSAGTYSVTLIATNSFGCTDTVTINIFVNPLPSPNFSATSVCVGNPTCFTDLTTISSGSVSGWSWNFGDASCPNNISNLQNPCHTYCAAGTYMVILTATSNNGCQNTVNMQVTVYSLPVASFTTSDVCLNSLSAFNNTSANSTSWDWNFGDNNTSTLQSPSHTYLAWGTYIVTLIASSGNGCTDTIRDTVTVFPLPIVSFTDDSVCVGNNTSFSDLSFIPSGSITGWNWNFGDPASGSNNTSSQQNPVHQFTSSGNFSVILTLTSNFGCTNSSTLSVLVYPLPAADFSISPNTTLGLIEFASFTDLSTGGVVQWLWQFGDGDTASAQNPSHLYSDTGAYIITLMVTSNYGCRDTIQYPIKIVDYAFYIPSAFTPNGDGNNDFFFGQGIGITEYELMIFDRWGNRIFYCKINDTETGSGQALPQTKPCQWNGKVEGSDERVQEDVYVWQVRLKNVFNKEFTFIGHVTVVK